MPTPATPSATPWLDLLRRAPGAGKTPELGAGIRRLAVLAAAAHRAERATWASGLPAGDPQGSFVEEGGR